MNIINIEVSFIVLILYCTISFGLPAGTDTEISNSIDGSTTEPEAKKEINGTDGSIVTLTSKHHSSVMYGHIVHNKDGIYLLNGKEIIIKKNNDSIQCNTIECPKDSIKCAVKLAKNPDVENETIITSKCADKDNKILLSDEKKIALSSESKGHKAYVEISFDHGNEDLLDADIAAEIKKAQSMFDLLHNQTQKFFDTFSKSMANMFKF